MDPSLETKSGASASKADPPSPSPTNPSPPRQDQPLQQPEATEAKSSLGAEKGDVSSLNVLASKKGGEEVSGATSSSLGAEKGDISFDVLGSKKEKEKAKSGQLRKQSEGFASKKEGEKRRSWQPQSESFASKKEGERRKSWQQLKQSEGSLSARSGKGQSSQGGEFHEDTGSRAHGQVQVVGRSQRQTPARKTESAVPLKSETDQSKDTVEKPVSGEIQKHASPKARDAKGKGDCAVPGQLERTSVPPEGPRITVNPAAVSFAVRRPLPFKSSKVLPEAAVPKAVAGQAKAQGGKDAAEDVTGSQGAGSSSAEHSCSTLPRSTSEPVQIKPPHPKLVRKVTLPQRKPVLIHPVILDQELEPEPSQTSSKSEQTVLPQRVCPPIFLDMASPTDGGACPSVLLNASPTGHHPCYYPPGLLDTTSPTEASPQFIRNEVSHCLAQYFPDALNEVVYNEQDSNDNNEQPSQFLRDFPGTSRYPPSQTLHPNYPQHPGGSPANSEGQSYLYTDPSVAARLLNPPPPRHPRRNEILDKWYETVEELMALSKKTVLTVLRPPPVDRPWSINDKMANRRERAAKYRFMGKGK
ncbi:hypothetical protein ACOMHN_054683 [Nucella lapillus]